MLLSNRYICIARRLSDAGGAIGREDGGAAGTNGGVDWPNEDIFYAARGD